MKQVLEFFGKAKKLLGSEFYRYNYERIRVSSTYFIKLWRSFSKEEVGRFPVSNASKGLLRPLFFAIGGSAKIRDVLLISEPKSVVEQLLNRLLEFEFVGQSDVRELNIRTLEDLAGLGYSEQEPYYDISSKDFLGALRLSGLPTEALRADLVVSQSLLEHVLDPVQTLDNLMQLVRDGGVLALQTCNPVMRLHRYPIDTLRFNPDFFLQYAKTRALHVQVKESGASIFAFFSNEFDHESLHRIEQSFSW